MRNGSANSGADDGAHCRREERLLEYPRTQEVAEVANFLDFDRLLVPSARWPASNLVIFGDRLAPGALEVIEDHGLIDWQACQRANKVAF
ncbi:RES domain-containing protein [Mesorhizobium sp. B2-8-5]|uniref:RES domain-containing protein n=1 Tax=Mesorhizobium sp. B2-8-5 TaxID=2589903 RepID=UPI0015E3894A|nr:RES domain-containing protein [Mesorhizobium sp. B2-8-5]UCI23989.1 RES family NAD+ phosphorylase [Mesorhizobium sp. B2-8-5]